MQPSVTIVVPCHDGAALLPATLAAALGQTVPDLEVVVVDDASSDATYRVALELAARDDRVRALRRETSSGNPAAARAFGARAARSDLLWFLDADDVPRVDVAARAIDHLDRHPAVGSLAFGIELIDEHGAPTDGRGSWGPWWVPARFGVRRARREDLEVDLLAVLDSACLISSVLCCRRAVYDRAGGWIDGGTRGYEDQDLALRLVLAAPMHRLPEAVVGYRVHARQYTAANAEQLESQRHAFLARWRRELDLPEASRVRLDRAFSRLDRCVVPLRAARAATRCVRAGRPLAAARFLGGAARIWLRTLGATQRRAA